MNCTTLTRSGCPSSRRPHPSGAGLSAITLTSSSGCSRGRLLQRVVAPIHQRIAPARLADVAARPLLEMSRHVPRDLAHVPVVVVGEAIAAFLEEPQGPP